MEGTATDRLVKKIQELYEARRVAFGSEVPRCMFKLIVFIVECGLRGVPISGSDARYLARAHLESYEDAPRDGFFQEKAAGMLAVIEKKFPAIKMCMKH